jgi:hypothetical protein
MHQPAQTAGQPVADFAQGVGATELAEQHGDELRPAGESFGGMFGAMLLDQSCELGTGKMLEQLIEQAGYLYHGHAFLVGDVWRSSGQGTIRQRSL